MDLVAHIAVGIILGIFHVLLLCVIIGNTKRMLVCTKTVDAKVRSVEEKLKEYKDSKTGRTKTKYHYRVFLRYDYKGQTYDACHNYIKHCPYFKGQETYLKINPFKPTDSWAKGEFLDILKVSLCIPVLVFFDLLYYSTFI